MFTFLCSCKMCKPVTCQWFSPGTPVSSTNKTDCHDITGILLKVELSTINCKPVLLVPLLVLENTHSIFLQLKF